MTENHQLLSDLIKGRETLKRTNSCQYNDLEQISLTEPILVKGMFNRWPKLQHWSNQHYLRQNISGSEFRATRSKSRESKTFHISEYFSYMQEQEKDPYYLKNCQAHLTTKIESDYSPVKAFECWYQNIDLEERKELAKSLGETRKHGQINIPLRMSWIFLGATGSYSPLHFDIWESSAWNISIFGKKLWLFVQSHLEKDKTDLLKYPFEKENVLELINHYETIWCVQEAGDLVFTPPGYLHGVFNLSGSFALTENFVNQSNYQVVEKHFEEHYSINALEAFRKLVNHSSGLK